MIIRADELYGLMREEGRETEGVEEEKGAMVM